MKYFKISQKKIKFLLVAVFFISGTALTAFSILTYKASFSVIMYEHTRDSKIFPEEKKLYKGEKIVGELKAKENNLGAIAVRIHNYNEGNTPLTKELIREDTIVFRMKEKGSNRWYYEGKYSGGQFHELSFFPFGFPKIENSKDKEYVFEIVSLDGTTKNALTLENDKPIIISNYQYDKQSLITDHNLLIYFLYQKFVYGQKHIELIFIAFVFYLPLWLTIYWKTATSIFLKSRFAKGLLKKFSKYKKQYNRLKLIPLFFPFFVTLEKITIYEAIIIVGILLDILLIKLFSLPIFLILFILWIYGEIINLNYQKKSFVIAFGLLILCPIFLQFDLKMLAQKSSIWAYLLLLIGGVRAVLETYKNSK